MEKILSFGLKKFLQYSDDTIDSYPDGEFPIGEDSV